MTVRTRLLLCLLTAGLSCLLPACRGREQTAKALYESELLLRIPSYSSAFAVWNFERPAARRLQASTWGQPLTETLQQLQRKLEGGEARQARLASILASMQSSGLLEKAKTAAESPLREMVAFGAFNPEKKAPEFGLLCSAAREVDLAARTAALQNELKNRGFSLTPHNFGAVSGFALSLAAEDLPAFPLDSIYMAASQNMLALATAPELVAPLLSGSRQDGMLRINSSAHFQKLKNALQPSQDEFSLAYAEAAFLLDNLEPFLPESADSGLRSQLKSLPVSAILFSQSMKDSPYHVTLAALQDTAEGASGWFSSLTSDNSRALPGMFPSASTLGLSLDGAPLKALKDRLLNEAPEGQSAAVRSELQPLDSLKRLSLSLLEAAPAAPLPGLVLRLEAADNAALLTSLRQALQGLAESSGLPLSQWQSKKVGDLDISYMQSPMFGVGLFLSADKDAVLAASSEEALKQALGRSEEVARLEKHLSSESRRLKIKLTPFGCFFGDMIKLSNLVKSLQGMLGAFTGGQEQIDHSLTETLSRLGQVYITAAYGDGIVAVQQVFLPPEKRN